MRGAPALLAAPTTSSLPLQRLLLFNLCSSGVYLACEVSLTTAKLLRGAPPPPPAPAPYALPALLCAWAALEALRLWLGYAGNLRERVPELCAFWLLTLVPQLPIVLFLTFFQAALASGAPLDLAAGLIPAALLLAELVVGAAALRALIARRAAEYALRTRAARLERQLDEERRRSILLRIYLIYPTILIYY